MKVSCTWRLLLTPDASTQGLEDQLDALMAQLLILESTHSDLMDSAVALDLVGRSIEVSLTSSGETRELCLHTAQAAVQAAVSASAIVGVTDPELVAA